MLMKTIASLCLLTGIALTFSSCGEGWENISSSIKSIQTQNNDDFRTWKAGPSVIIKSTNSTLTNWDISAGSSYGSIQTSVLNNTFHWAGSISYTEQLKKEYTYKDDECNYHTKYEYYDGDTYTDEITINAYSISKGWNEVNFQTFGYKTTPGGIKTNTGADNSFIVKTLRPDDFNTLMVYSYPDMTYQFKFVTQEVDNFNSWTPEEIQSSFLNTQARICLLLVPVLITVFQY